MELEVAIPQVGIAIAEKYMDLNGYVKKTSLSDDDYETEKQNALQTLFICQFPSSRKEDITDMLQATEKFFGECYSCTKDVPPLVCLGK